MLINTDQYRSISINSGSIRIDQIFQFIYWSVLIRYWCIVDMLLIYPFNQCSRSLWPGANGKAPYTPKTPFPEVYQSVSNDTNQYWSWKIYRINKDQSWINMDQWDLHVLLLIHIDLLLIHIDWYWSTLILLIGIDRPPDLHRSIDPLLILLVLLIPLILLICQALYIWDTLTTLLWWQID